MTKELRRCPFCGGEPTLSERKSHATWYRVICLNSMCVICPSTAEFEDKKSAIKVWNRREPIDKIVEQLEESDEIIRVFPKLQPNLTPFCEHPYHLPKPKPVSLKPIECIPLTEAIEIVKGGAV